MNLRTFCWAEAIEAGMRTTAAAVTRAATRPANDVMDLLPVQRIRVTLRSGVARSAGIREGAALGVIVVPEPAGPARERRRRIDSGQALEPCLEDFARGGGVERSADVAAPHAAFAQ